MVDYIYGIRLGNVRNAAISCAILNHKVTLHRDESKCKQRRRGTLNRTIKAVIR